MKIVQKDALYPGNWHLKDGRVFRATPSDVKQLATRLSQMISAGLHVPVTWEHQDAMKPATREEWQARNAELAKLTVGHTSSATLGRQGELIAGFDAQDEDVPYLRKAKFVSPNIEWDYRDQTGRVWDGPSITHLAVTPNPVQHTQEPFPLSQGEGALSLADLLLSRSDRSEPIRLSLSDYEPVALAGNPPPFSPKKKKPADDEPEPDESLEDEPDEEQDEAPEEETDEPEPQPQPKASEDTQDTPADNVDVEGAAPTDPTAAPPMSRLAELHPKMQELLGLLAQTGHPLPDDTTPENLVDRLIVSLMAAQAAEGGPQNVQAVETNPPVVAMSQTATKEKPAKPAKPETKTVQLSQAEFDELKTLRQEKLVKKRKDIERRLKELLTSGRISNYIYGNLTSQLKTVHLSLSDDDLVSAKILAKIEAYEDLPKNATGFDIENKKIQEVPLSASGYMRPDEDDEATAELTKRMVDAAGGAEK